MPWDTIVDPFDAGNAPQGQAEAAMQQTQLTGNQIAQAEATLMHAMNVQIHNQYAGNPWGQGHLAQQAAAYQRYPRRGDDFRQLLNEFNAAFQHGIREVTVDDHIYYALLDHFRTDIMDTPPGVQHLRLVTAGGYLTVRPEGAKKVTGDDFDRYMEETDEKLP